ncbi:MAG: response regulator [Anaerolineae bacterium]
MVTPDLQQVAKMLTYVSADLLIVDDTMLAQQSDATIQKLKRSFPHLPVAVLTESTSEADHERRFAAGADLLLTPDLSATQMHQQVNIILHQRSHHRTLVSRSQKLYLVASLPLLMRGLLDPHSIVFQATKTVINLLDVEAVSVVIKSGYQYTAYVGRKPLQSIDQLVESTILEDANNPIFWSIRHRMIQVYNDLQIDPRVALPAALGSHGAALIVPFESTIGQYGAIIFFLPQGTPVTNEDILIYEQIASQIESTLLRAHHSQLQTRQLTLNRQLVEAWGKFANLHFSDEIVRLLCSVVSDINVVKNVLIALNDTQSMSEYTVDNCGGDLVRAFDSDELHRLLERLQTRLKNQSQMMVLSATELAQLDYAPIVPLFDSEQFALVPVSVLGLNLGVMIIGAAPNSRFDAPVVYLIENLVQIAVNALQGIMLRSVALQNHSELIAIICSITEGIFYVDANQKVAFYNPQFLELTSIGVSEWINRDADALLRAIAMASQFPMQVYNQLQAAVQQLMVDEEYDYPIVTVPLAERPVELRVEFVKIDNGPEKPTWMGVIHQLAESQGSLMLERLLERLRVAHTQLRGAVHTLTEQHGHFSFNERDELLKQIDADTASAGTRWNQFYDLFKLYIGNTALHRDRVNLSRLLERAVNDARSATKRTAVSLQPASRTVIVKVDEFYFAKALSDLLARLVDLIPATAQLEITVEILAREVHIRVGSTGSPNRFGDIEDILTDPSYLTTGTVDDLDMLIAAEFIRRNGAYLEMERGDATVQRLSIVVPVEPLTAALVEPASTLDTPVTTPPAVDVQNSAPSREPRSIMIVEGKSTLTKQLTAQLEEEGFSLLRYDAGTEAVLDVTATYLDLIIIDVRLSDENGFEVCQRTRKRTETPIMLIADTANTQEKVRGLQVGADDFVTGPMTDEELLARVRVIVNRRYIAARSSEPMQFGDLYVDFARRAVFLKGAPIELTRIEYDLLYTLIINRGQTVTHKQLLTQVWGPEYQDESQYLWVNISRLRKKLEPTQDSPRYIRTQSGIGYYFTMP